MRSRKANNLVKGLTLGALITGFSACSGGGGGSGSGGVAGKIRVGQIGSTNATLMASTKWGDVAQGAGNYSWAKVDGLKIQVTAIRGTKSGKVETFGEFSAPKLIELAGDSGAISIEEDISVPAGDYTDVAVTFKNQVTMKAFCRTDNESLYTTATGIKKCVGSCGASDNLPSDYDYYSYDFMLADAPDGDTVMEINKLKFSVAETDTPRLTLLVDTSYTVTCADMQTSLDVTNDPGTMAPFSWQPRTGKMSDYYKGTQGNFGVGYLPLFTYLTTDVNEALPVGETYAASATIADIDDGTEAANLAKAMITTVAFDANDNIVAARSRNFDADHQTTLQQGWSGFSTDSPNSYTMMNGEHWGGAAADFSEARWLQDFKIVGFQRSAGYTTRQTINVVDGPDCGKNLSDRNQPCQTGGPVTTYWKRIRR